MNRNRIIQYIIDNGWTLTEFGDKFDFYKPPVSLGFEYSYNLPIPKDDNSEDFNQNLRGTIDFLTQLYDIKEEEFYLETTGYFNTLLRDALYFKMSSENVKFGKTLEVNEIWEFLKNLSTSYSNYVKINFIKKFAEILNYDEKRTNVAMNKLLNLSSLRVVALEYHSFSFGVSADKMMGKHEIENKTILEWRNNLITDFNNEVIDIDFNVDKTQKELLNKYEKDEIKLIYLPIIKSINNNSSYSISLTNKNFSLKRKLKRIPINTLNSFFPKSDVENLEKKSEINFIKTVIPVDKSKKFIKLNVSDFDQDNLFTQRFAEITSAITEINYSQNDKFTLLKPVEFVLSHNPYQSIFEFELVEVNIKFNITNINNIQKEFDLVMKDYIEMFKNDPLKNDPKTIPIYDFLKQIIPPNRLI
jgi:hypothetical protein